MTLQEVAHVIGFILRECHNFPDDSLVDIANDTFHSAKVPLTASWADDDRVVVVKVKEDG